MQYCNESRQVSAFRVARDLTVGTSSADCFFHLGWGGVSASERDDCEVQAANITYTLGAVELAAKLGCARFVYAGSQAELNATHAYAISKNAAADLAAIACEQRGIDFIRTRIFSIFGEGDSPNTLISSLISSLQRGEKLPLTKCEQIWDYMYVKDCARALYLLGELGKVGEIYNIASGVARPLHEFVHELRDIIAPNCELGIGEKPYSPNQVMRLCADISPLTRDTGFVPQYSFADAVKGLLDL